MTYGLGPAGYNVRINCDDALIAPGHFLLAATVERFQMPNDVMGIVH
jgi:dCTP deaminase